METKKRLATCIGKKTADLIVLPWPLWMGFPQSAHACPLLIAVRWTSSDSKASAHSTGSSLSAVLLDAAHPSSPHLILPLRAACPAPRGGGQREEGSVDVFTPPSNPCIIPRPQQWQKDLWLALNVHMFLSFRPPQPTYFTYFVHLFHCF